MCGITGMWRAAGLAAADPESVLGAMTDALHHRGPDDRDLWVDAPAGIGLGFRRLAILDLSPLGRQPMVSACGRYVVVFNGEIYNFRALRHELEQRGHQFRGRSDTEVLLAAVRQWGVPGAIERCNGMFAIALWDRERRTLHLVRDRAGEKPLYYGWAGDTLVFGSELKALRAHPALAPEVDRQALARFVHLGYVPGPLTILRDVHKLPPATILTLEPGSGRAAVPRPYWSARDVTARGLAEPFTGPADAAVDALDELLRDAVRMRLESDVPLGAFLSGGVDSSLIVALMCATSGAPVRTFTIGFGEARYDEAPHAAAVARHLGTHHTELRATPADALALVERLPRLYDEPFADPSQIPTFLVAALTRQHVTVSLSGDAGDELFGGYRRYVWAPALWRRIGWLPPAARRAAGKLCGAVRGMPGLAAAGRLVRPITGKRGLADRLRQAEEILGVASPAAYYDYLMSYWKRSGEVVLGGDGAENGVSSRGNGVWTGGAAPAEAMMATDLVTYLPDDILVKVDRASMGVSLESRIPLLDHRVIELAARLPLHLKIREGRGKWVLRQLLDRYVPRPLVERPKHGFDAPVGAWLRGPLREWAGALLAEDRLRTEGFFRPAPIVRKWREHLAGVTSWDYDLWTILMFQAWHETWGQAAPRVATVA